MVSKALQQTLNTPETSIIGRKMFEVYPALKGSMRHDALQKALAGEVVHIGKHLSYYGPDIYVDSYFIPFNSKSNKGGLVIMSRNVTEIHKAEKMLEEKNDELKRSNDSLQQFAFVASHDLKEPIRKIKTYASMIMDEFDGTLPDKGHNFLRKIHASAARMIDMVDGLLTYSTIEAVNEEPEQVELNSVLQDIVSDLELFITEKKATVRFAALPSVQGIRILLYQLFLNLIKNAIKFSKENTAPQISIDFETSRQNGIQAVRISVADNGIGFRQEDAERIFRTFARLHAKNQYEGSGLGLALCKRIVEQHHGTIEAIGEPGAGAQFIITLPLNWTGVEKNLSSGG